MQNISPRQYFETRLRKLPVYKCLVNKDWESAQMAHVMVMRKHVNGKVSGAVFLVDLLCLGVKDVHWYFNTDEEDVLNFPTDVDYKNYMEEIPYDLAHNIVYAGLEFADLYTIKPHPDFSIARYALEEDDDVIPVIDIETGENGIPHLIERYPGQYADAHAKLKKHAGEGNYKVMLVTEDDDWDDADDEEYEEDDEATEWDEDDFSSNDGELDEEELSLKEIPHDELTAYDAMLLPKEDLENEELVKSRSEVEQIILILETAVRVFDNLMDDKEELAARHPIDAAKIEQIRELDEQADNDFMHTVPYPNGCEEDAYDTGIEAFFKNAPTLIQSSSTSQKAKLLKQIVQPQSDSNIIALAYCMIYLLQDNEGNVLFDTLKPFIEARQHLPLIALAQTYLVTAHPDKFPYEPLITSNSIALGEVFEARNGFNSDEYCFFYALRCLQATQQQDFPMAATWYRMMVETEEADKHLGILFPLFNTMPPVAFNFFNNSKGV